MMSSLYPAVWWTQGRRLVCEVVCSDSRLALHLSHCLLSRPPQPDVKTASIIPEAGSDVLADKLLDEVCEVFLPLHLCRYAWTIAQCAGCYNHVGWLFTATSEDLRPRMFWGIKRDAIVPSSEDSSTPSRLML
ncbi:unnamed protein product [Schistocephalus solidus]|uniref:CULT domain-containing protein n=1 Tax=Schistocephalus solidus TaxID=70667 RepID=A0A183TEY5_SCHSO|nr:unnamed protein product [Schistocephalus solidus]